MYSVHYGTVCLVLFCVLCLNIVPSGAHAFAKHLHFVIFFEFVSGSVELHMSCAAFHAISLILPSFLNWFPEFWINMSYFAKPFVVQQFLLDYSASFDVFLIIVLPGWVSVMPTHFSSFSSAWHFHSSVVPTWTSLELFGNITGVIWLGDFWSRNLVHVTWQWSDFRLLLPVQPWCAPKFVDVPWCSYLELLTFLVKGSIETTPDTMDRGPQRL